jgi:hypothetical protein
VIADLIPDPVVYVCGHRPACNARMPVYPYDRRTPMHDCGAAAFMSLPMIREGVDADVRLVPREDYVGADHGQVRTDADGRVFMRSEVVYADGHTDAYVYAPVAVWRGRSEH